MVRTVRRSSKHWVARSEAGSRGRGDAGTVAQRDDARIHPCFENEIKKRLGTPTRKDTGKAQVRAAAVLALLCCAVAWWAVLLRLDDATMPIPKMNPSCAEMESSPPPSQSHQGTSLSGIGVFATRRRYHEVARAVSTRIVSRQQSSSWSRRERERERE